MREFSGYKTTPHNHLYISISYVNTTAITNQPDLLRFPTIKKLVKNFLDLLG